MVRLLGVRGRSVVRKYEVRRGKLAHDSVVLSNWFERLQALRAKFGVQDEDIWNMDETGFRVGVGKSRWIITTSISKRTYLASDFIVTLRETS